MELAPNLEKYCATNPVLVTGHTGFKGTWLTLLLKSLGIPVVGVALEPIPKSLYSRIPSLGLEAEYFQDIRDYTRISKIIGMHNPSVVFHLAAQPLVMESYQTPRETFETNVMGTVNVLDAFRNSKNARLFVGVTTDKVYRNVENERRFVESDPLSGKDPYSASKVGTESALSAWRQIFNETGGPQVISVRAGNVIGGGDYASNRIIPDIVRGIESQHEIRIRNPQSTRPWQHVLDPLRGYLMASEYSLVQGGIDAFNFGPDGDSLSVSQLIKVASSVWKNEIPQMIYEKGDSRLEAGTLQLDSNLSKRYLNWHPVWTQEEAIHDTFSWWNKVLYKDISAEEACSHDIEKTLSQDERN